MTMTIHLSALFYIFGLITISISIGHMFTPPVGWLTLGSGFMALSMLIYLRSDYK